MADEQVNVAPEETQAPAAEEQPSASPESANQSAQTKPAENPAKTSGDSSSTQKPETPETAEDEKDNKKEKKSKDKPDKKSGADKRQNAKLKKEWENSIVSNKRVKREEMRRKFKRIVAIMLVFSLIVTSIVYVMLLFVEENSVHITASSEKGKSISLSFDNDLWTPYLNANGPESMKDLSYNPVYHLESIDSVEKVRSLLVSPDIEVGRNNGNQYIRFTFMVKNMGDSDAEVAYEMTLEDNKLGLKDAIRVMWGESFKSSDLTDEEDPTSQVVVYASLSRNPRLAQTDINMGRTPEQGYKEYVAYPVGSDENSYSLANYEASLNSSEKVAQARKDGYFETEPFYSDDYVFRRTATLDVGDIMYCYVSIWIEGSDFDCVDSALQDYIKLGINFVAY